MKAYLVLIFSFVSIIIYSSCGSKNESIIVRKDSTVIPKDTIKKNINFSGDDSGYYKSKLPLDDYIKQHPNLNNRIELSDLLRKLALNKKNVSSGKDLLQEWTLFDNQPSSPVNWLTKNPKDKKVGEVIILLNGQPAVILDVNTIPIIWTITLIGNEAGADKMNLDCSILTHDFGEFHIQDLFKKQNVKLDILKSTGDPPVTLGGGSILNEVKCEKYFKISFPGKEPFWMTFLWSCFPQGCRANFVIYYNENQFKTETEKK